MSLTKSVVATGIGLVLASSAVAEKGGPAPRNVAAVDQDTAIRDFQQAHPQARFFRTQERITRIYGRTFGFGSTPEQTAEQFRSLHAGVFGVAPNELDPRGPLFDERHTQDIMYDWDAESYKFTLVYYTQYESGIPVFRADLRLLIRNEPDHPLVLAASSLRDLGTFSVGRIEPFDVDRAKQAAIQEVPDLINFTEPRRVIWAGVDNMVVEATVSVEFVADNGREATSHYAKWLFVADAKTGAILYQENQVLNTDVVGNVSGMATPGSGADICADEILEPMPYARVAIDGGNFAYADENGDFVIPNAGNNQVTVRSAVRGDFFRVFNSAGADSELTTNVIPPGPADFVHNEANNSEFVRAEVNGYVESNVVRDWILDANPDYPTITDDREFRVNVNIGGSCNAFYDGNSINFFRAGGGCSNMAFSIIVHHEYGHHLVATGGSGQGQYGEGMGDTLGVIIEDDPVGGRGWQGDCDDGARNADNDIQYPCSGPIHFCGQLLSGCVWSTRNELIVTEPDDYSTILMDLAVNSVLVHSGSDIRPQITIDWLTLDDDDGDIGNGTPHYSEICTGFGAHNMDCPELDPLEFNYPDGRPDFVPPSTPTAFTVEIVPGAWELDETSPTQYVSVDGGPFESTPLEQQLGGGSFFYNVVLPGADCFSRIDWYLTAESTNENLFFDPPGAPSETYQASVGDGPPGDIILEEDFEAPVGYTVTGDASDGHWDVGVPVDCDRGDPPTDFDGSGSCYLTDNDPSDCNSDVDGGATTLTSPEFDLSADGDPLVSYARWFSTTGSQDDFFAVDISNDGGNNWVNLETLGPDHPDTDNGWFLISFRVADFVEPTNQVRLRWTVADLGGGSVVEAAVDALTVEMLQCDDSTVVLLPEDLQIIRGIKTSGELPDLFASDDSRMVFQPGITQNPDEPPIWLELTGSSVTDTPTELRFILETRIDTPAVTQTISLFNYNTDMYEEVHTGTTPFNTDGTVDVSVDGDPSRFVNSETLEVKAQLTWKPGPLVLLYPWNVGIDQSVWKVVP